MSNKKQVDGCGTLLPIIGVMAVLATIIGLTI